MKLRKSSPEEVSIHSNEVEQVASKINVLLAACSTCIDNISLQKEMQKSSQEISVLIKQLLMYAQYQQPLQEVLELLTKQLKSLVVLAQTAFPKSV